MASNYARDGGPAYPTLIGLPANLEPDGRMGLTVRDWFAGQALAGLISNPEIQDGADDLAKFAYSLADAMIARRHGVDGQGD